MSKKNLLIFITFALSACSPAISNFNSYLPQPFPRTEFMPNSETIEGKKPKVVVFEFDQSKNQVAESANLGNSLVVNVENVLTENRLAELVDRKIASKLKQEIALSEMNKNDSYKGPQVADYAISGSISNAGFSKKYSAGFLIPNKNGGVTKIEPKYTYTGDVAGNIKIYELPSMQVVENFEFSGKKSRSENVKTDNELSFSGVNFAGKRSEGVDKDDDLVRKAGKLAIESIDTEIKSFFAKKGFILEKRVLKNKVIFKISLGSADGIKTGDKFEVIGKYQNQNPITNKEEIETRIIASGKVSNKIDPKSCWVLIDDSETFNKIRLGDLVKFKYQKTWLDQAIKVGEGFAS